MKSGGIVPAMCAIVVLGSAGCQQADSSLEPRREAPRAESPPAPVPGQSPGASELVVSGELRTVDPGAKSFTLMEGDREHRFTFSDTTLVTGAAGTQGLAGREGDRVTVYYRETPDAKVALRIALQ